MKPVTSVVLLSIASMLGGCAYLTSPMAVPVQQEYVGSIFGDRQSSVISLTSERRTVVVRKGTVPRNNAANDTDHAWLFCAEPPPDVAANLVSTFKAAGDVTALKGDAKASAEFNRSLSTISSALFSRSQGLQLFRDGLFNLCQARLNGFISPDQYEDQYSKLLERAFDLIKQEIPSVIEKKAEAMAARAENAAARANAAQHEAEKAQTEATSAADRAQKEVAKAKEASKKE